MEVSDSRLTEGEEVVAHAFATYCRRPSAVDSRLFVPALKAFLPLLSLWPCEVGG